MKHQTLNMAQMEHLKQLGVDTSKASVVLLFFDEDGNELGWEVENFGKTEPVYQCYNEESEIWESTNAQYFDAETGSYDHSYRDSCGVFTLQDIMELLPTSFHLKNPEKYAYLRIESRPGGDILMSYENMPQKTYAIGNSLLEVSYQMLVLLAKNKLISHSND